MPKNFDLLAPIEKPSRYLGTEVNAVRKNPDQVRLRIALAFPDLYEIGTSHFGLQILYHLLNQQPEIAAERVFAPALDMEAHLRKTKNHLFSLESHTPLHRFDIVGFSLLYELNYTNILTMLELGGIPQLAAERDRRHALVIAGGPCTCNPEPVADFFDAMVIGDGEAVVLELARHWFEWKQAGARTRRELLERWAGVEGVYVPAFFEPCYDAGGLQSLRPRLAGYLKVRRAIVADLDAAPFPDHPVVAFGKPVHDRLRLEVSRGCTRGCRFCQAGMLYRPVRERAPARLLDLAQRSLSATGYEDLSLLSLSTGDYGCIVPLVQRLMGRHASQRVAVSLPSLRAGSLSPELMEQIRRVRKTGFTIAPEAGSQRLRDVINKNISEEEILTTVGDAFRLGWQVVKLYFMIGLPTETEEDLRALVDLVRKLRQHRRPAGRRGQINVSVATFIPKAHTAFQWAGQVPAALAREKLGWIQQNLQAPGIEFKWQNPDMSLLEGVFARGDRRLARVLRAAHRRGCRFDGWGDQFQLERWVEAFHETGIDPDFFNGRLRDPQEPLPWDHIDVLVEKSYLQAEWQKAIAAAKTEDCRYGACNACGVCDFETIAPRLHPDMPLEVKGSSEGGIVLPAGYRKLQILYAKLGPARYFGHLELVNIFLRALRRAQIPVKFSEGFHPKPKVAFENPIPTGMESQEERLVVTVAREVAPEALLNGLNAQLPAGLKVIACRETIEGPPRQSTYRVCGLPSRGVPQAVFKRPELDPQRQVNITTPKGKLKKIDAKDILKSVHLVHPGCLEMTLSCEPGKTVRPVEVLKQVFDFSAEQVNQVVICKLAPVAAGRGA